MCYNIIKESALKYSEEHGFIACDDPKDYMTKNQFCSLCPNVQFLPIPIHGRWASSPLGRQKGIACPF